MLLEPIESPAVQYQAAIEGAVLFDLSDRDQIELTGRDRASFLHNFCTQEIKRLPAGHGAETFITNIKGRIAGHGLVFVGDEALWLDASPGSASTLVPHLDRYLITEDVQIADRSKDWGEVAVVGPQGAAIVNQFVEGSGSFLPFQHGHHGGITVRQCKLTIPPCWLVGTERSRLPELVQKLLQAGAIAGGRDVWEGLRIEAGEPVYGLDLTEDNLAHEAGRTTRAISFTKGCYLGQEPIARLESLGHTNRELRGLLISGTQVPVTGTEVIQPETGASVGTISSATLSPGHGVVALAMLRREVNAPGSVVRVPIGPDTLVSATVYWPAAE